MNETKLLQTIAQKIKNIDERTTSFLYTNYSEKTFNNQLEKTLKFKTLPLNSVKENLSNNNFTSNLLLVTSKGKNKRVGQFSSKFNYELEMIESLNLTDLNIVKKASDNTICNKNKTNKNAPVSSQTAYTFLPYEPSTLTNKQSITNRIIMKSLIDFHNLQKIDFHKRNEIVIKSRNISFSDISKNTFNLDHDTLSHLCSCIKKSSLFSSINQMNSMIIKNDLKDGLNLLKNEEYLFQKYNLTVHFIKKILNLEEKALKLNKFLNRFNSNKNDEKSFRLFLIPEEFSKSVLENDFNFLLNDHASESIYNFECKLDTERFLKYANKILNKIPTVEMEEKLNNIDMETSTNLYVDNFNKSFFIKPIKIPRIQISRHTNMKNNKSLLSNFEYDLDFLKDFEIKFPIKKSEIEVKINPECSKNICIRKSSKKRKYEEMLRSHSDSIENSGLQISPKSDENNFPNKKILINIPSLQSKIGPKIIKTILDEAESKNLEAIPIDDNFFCNLFNNIDIIINSCTGIIFLDLNLFEDEYDFKPYEKLSELINTNYLSYNQIVLSLFSGISQISPYNKTYKSLNEFINKNFSELAKNFNLEINFICLSKITEIFEHILSINNNLKDILTLPSSDYNFDINKISNLCQKFHFFNLYEILSLTVEIKDNKCSTKIVNFLTDKYNKKKIILEASTILN